MQPKDELHKGIYSVLREHGFRVTNARVKLLIFLRKASKPLSIRSILSDWKEAPNQATVYRMLSDLSEARIIKRVALQSGILHFEYTPDHPHHHHIMCTDCGAIEDVEHCDIESVQKQIVARLKKFSSINAHSLEFFGRCNKCKI